MGVDVKRFLLSLLFFFFVCRIGELDSVSSVYLYGGGYQFQFVGIVAVECLHEIWCMF